MKLTKIILIIATLFVAAMCAACQNKPQNVNIYVDMPNFEKKFPEKTLKINEVCVKENQDSVITYSSMEEAEWKMVRYFFSDGRDIQQHVEDYNKAFDYDLFEQVVMSDTSSMTYPFDSICYYSKISIIDSKDGNVRCYAWDMPHCHTMSDLRTIVQYRFNNDIHVQKRLCVDEESEESLEFVLAPSAVYVLHGEKENFYLIPKNMNEWSSLAYVQSDIYKLTKDGLQVVSLFNDGSKDFENVSFEYDIPDWYFKTNKGEGYQWLDFFDETTSTFYVPNTDGPYLTDRYFAYQWDGNRMKLVGKVSVANPFLHPSLKDYEALEFVKMTDSYRVRIDKMKEGNYRYAVWAADKTIGAEPELVLLNGFWDDKTERYVFRNKEFEYNVGECKLIVLKNGKKVLEEEFKE